MEELRKMRSGLTAQLESNQSPPKKLCLSEQSSGSTSRPGFSSSTRVSVTDLVLSSDRTVPPEQPGDESLGETDEEAEKYCAGCFGSLAPAIATSTDKSV